MQRGRGGEGDLLLAFYSPLLLRLPFLLLLLLLYDNLVDDLAPLAAAVGSVPVRHAQGKSSSMFGKFPPAIPSLILHFWDKTIL